VLGGAVVSAVVVVHLLLCVAHAAASGTGGAAGGAVIAGLARHHAAVIDISRLPHGTRLQVSGGGGVNVGHVCVKAALEERTDVGGVPASAGAPLPLSCAPVAAAESSSGLVRVVAERGPPRCMILRC
jgi:hypothetical protein